MTAFGNEPKTLDVGGQCSHHWASETPHIIYPIDGIACVSKLFETCKESDHTSFIITLKSTVIKDNL